jgi:DNA-binding NarL/FixJ family response regulator
MNSTKESAISIALLDKHGVLCDGLECLFQAVEGVSVVGNVTTPEDLTACLDFVKVDIVVMDLIFSGHDALRCIEDWSKAHPQTKFLVLSQLPEGIYAQRVLNAGGSGYLMKDVRSGVLIDGVRRVAAGEVVVSPLMANVLLTNLSKGTAKDETNYFDRLTARELHVLTLVGQGHATAAIAEEMGISKKTVSTFKERIKSKLSLASSMQLAQVAIQHFGRAV